ncbi:MAG: ATP-binding cassette domain-containing protein, partial [Emcibacteraceae bacterium]|nr:ATP-binding cassette domain-containing protein [Emcibacteraceae bacterium]
MTLSDPNNQVNIPAVKINELHKSFGDLMVLKGIDLEIEQGEVVCILGTSGSGKSTLLGCINQLTIPDCGTVLIKGERIGYELTSTGNLKKASQAKLAKQRSRIGYVFQQFNLWPHRT